MRFKSRLTELSLVLLLLGVVFFLGCVGGKSSPEEQKDEAIERCVEICNSKKKQMNLSDGPCLSNGVTASWVCDVAHEPRKEVDNKEENKCSDYVEEKKIHFVEVTPDCKLIRAK